MADEKKTLPSSGIVPAVAAAAPSMLEQILAQLVAGQEKMAAAVSALAAKDEPASDVPYVRPPPRPLAPEHKGPKTYRIKAAHYRAGVLYDVGSLITVTDETPSKTWEPVTPESEAKAAVPVPLDLSKAKLGRPSDVTV